MVVSKWESFNHVIFYREARSVIVSPSDFSNRLEEEIKRKNVSTLFPLIEVCRAEEEI
jgi:hypothetical protein